jgi:hypothetical protein
MIDVTRDFRSFEDLEYAENHHHYWVGTDGSWGSRKPLCLGDRTDHIYVDTPLDVKLCEKKKKLFGWPEHGGRLRVRDEETAKALSKKIVRQYLMHYCNEMQIMHKVDLSDLVTIINNPK